ncbi:DNA-processing protein DprA [Bifidobacterium sp. 82T24]|uniref:DNA-processing protein DprA n=1 Tax=Bifidobacterium pluvialisilvae TaxID=2834436 RepID=UPI001C59429F|nr:DNA-processing protein DprA [Bifidobacterium pluvialisilvae]MBW3087824.1 DNA-processing protein DprA [Bifidobacterium pluvialisilvae]
MTTTPETDTLCRAALTHCGDGPDALMFAALKGAESPRRLLALLCEETTHQRPDWLGYDGPGGARELDRVFVTGLARWGRRADARAVEGFHTALDRWRGRLGRLPARSREGLTAWFVHDERQWIIGPDSPYWPTQLADLSIRSDWAPPLCLWGVGDPAALTSCDAPVAVVGSREANDYGRFVARGIGLHAARAGHLVVSGGAMGADAAAHWGAIAAWDERSGIEDGPNPAGRTVAVFAGGLDHIGPSRNLPLFEAMTDRRGALISEMPPGTIPEARRFLLRNRIIAALGRVVVVAQARHRSGALNTATWAAEMSRELYAAPGDIDEPYNTGCNRLVHEGKAVLLASATDVSDICHAPHDAVGDDGGNERDDGADPTRTDAPADPLQRAVTSAIRSCGRRHVAATPDAILDHLSTNGTSPPCDAATLQLTLAALEARDIIVIGADGVISLVPRTRGGRSGAM